ncbi:hypothetical protein HDU96_007019 [Phlyctochytrium bullatum]|nr:hypothetical protein HDU96_007019 [Phlyctochytrium bullatum]
MPVIEFLPASSSSSSFVRGSPGLDDVLIEGRIAIYHRNPTATKRIHLLQVLFKGATVTKVRPRTVLGVRGKKYKGRWAHAGSPPLQLVGPGAEGTRIRLGGARTAAAGWDGEEEEEAARTENGDAGGDRRGSTSRISTEKQKEMDAMVASGELLLLHPGEVTIFPFAFRFSKHQAAVDMPPSLILPSIGPLRSRAETRYVLEARMGWHRRNGVRAFRRVAVEVWIDWITPSVLAGMLRNRLPAPSPAPRPGSASSRRPSDDRSATTPSPGIGLVDSQRQRTEWTTPAYDVALDRAVVTGGDTVRLVVRFREVPPPPAPVAIGPQDVDVEETGGAGIKGFGRAIGRLLGGKRAVSDTALERTHGDAEGDAGKRVWSSAESVAGGKAAWEGGRTASTAAGWVPLTIDVAIEERVIVRAPVDKDHQASVAKANPVFHESAVGLAMAMDEDEDEDEQLASREVVGGEVLATVEEEVGPDGAMRTLPRKQLVRYPTPPELKAEGGERVKMFQWGGMRVKSRGKEGKASGVGPATWVKCVEERRELPVWQWARVDGGNGQEVERDVEIEADMIIPPIYSAPDTPLPAEALHPDLAGGNPEDDTESVAGSSASRSNTSLFQQLPSVNVVPSPQRRLSTWHRQRSSDTGLPKDLRIVSRDALPQNPPADAVSSDDEDDPVDANAPPVTRKSSLAFRFGRKPKTDGENDQQEGLPHGGSTRTLEAVDAGDLASLSRTRKITLSRKALAPPSAPTASSGASLHPNAAMVVPVAKWRSAEGGLDGRDANRAAVAGMSASEPDLRNGGPRGGGSASTLSRSRGSAPSVAASSRAGTTSMSDVRAETEGLHPTVVHSIISIEHRLVIRLQGYADPQMGGKVTAATLYAPVTVCGLDLQACRRLAAGYRFSPDDAMFLTGTREHPGTSAGRGSGSLRGSVRGWPAPAPAAGGEEDAEGRVDGEGLQFGAPEPLKPPAENDAPENPDSSADGDVPKVAAAREESSPSTRGGTPGSGGGGGPPARRSWSPFGDVQSVASSESGTALGGAAAAFPRRSSSGALLLAPDPSPFVAAARPSSVHARSADWDGEGVAAAAGVKVGSGMGKRPKSAMALRVAEEVLLEGDGGRAAGLAEGVGGSLRERKAAAAARSQLRKSWVL